MLPRNGSEQLGSASHRRCNTHTADMIFNVYLRAVMDVLTICKPYEASRCPVNHTKRQNAAQLGQATCCRLQCNIKSQIGPPVADTLNNTSQT